MYVHVLLTCTDTLYLPSSVTSDSIAKFLRGGGRKMWKERGSKLAIILVDATTTSAALSVSDTAGLPLFQLRDAIHKVSAWEN